jgi:glycosyltransferase involved in cell wall biosynthesis
MPISIVMPTYNGMKYLEQAVNSVLSQSRQDWELIISDDGSKDETRAFLSKLQDPRIQVHFQPSNLGIFGNLNFLFSLASGEITQILCQDDYFVDSGALDRLISEWSAFPPEIAYARFNHQLDSQSRNSLFEDKVLPPIVPPEKSDLFFFIFGCIPGNLSNVSVRTEAVKRAGWFRTDLPYAGDFEFWSRLGRSRPWAIAKTSVSVIRRHEEQASATLNPKGELLPQMRFILETLYQSLSGKGYSATHLRLMATTTYISLHRDAGVKLFVNGRGVGYLRRVSKEFDSSSFSFGSFAGWLIYFACLGGRAFSVSAAKQLVKEGGSAS